MPLSEQILAWAIGHGNTLLFGLVWFAITAVGGDLGIDDGGPPNGF